MDNKSVVPGNEEPSSSTDLWPSFFFPPFTSFTCNRFLNNERHFYEELCCRSRVRLFARPHHWNALSQPASEMDAFAAINSLSRRFECEKLRKETECKKEKSPRRTKKKFKSHIRVNHGIIRNLLPIFYPSRFVLGSDGCLCVCCRRLWRTMCVRAANRMIQMPLIDAFLLFVRLFSAAKMPGEITCVIQPVRFDAMGRRWAIRRDPAQNCDLVTWNEAADAPISKIKYVQLINCIAFLSIRMLLNSLASQNRFIRVVVMWISICRASVSADSSHTVHLAGTAAAAAPEQTVSINFILVRPCRRRRRFQFRVRDFSCVCRVCTTLLFVHHGTSVTNNVLQNCSYVWNLTCVAEAANGWLDGWWLVNRHVSLVVRQRNFCLCPNFGGPIERKSESHHQSHTSSPSSPLNH